MTIKKIAITTLLTFIGVTSAKAITIDPAEFFAYSRPFHGNQVLLLSHQSCPVKINGVSSELLSRFEVTANKGQKWNKALLNTKFGAFDNCWVSIKKGNEDGVLTCNVENSSLTSYCSILAKSFFMDTADLPKAPSQPKF